MPQNPNRPSCGRPLTPRRTTRAPHPADDRYVFECLYCRVPSTAKDHIRLAGSLARPALKSLCRVSADYRSRRIWARNFDIQIGTLGLLETLMAMSNFQWLLHRIPGPSVRLFLALAFFGALIVMSFAMLDGSGRVDVAPQVQADHGQVDQQ
jgi:hypothetical protein